MGWEEHDRGSAPCESCGAKLYDKFWGHGGWVKTDLVTGHHHGPEDCVRVLRAALDEANERLKAR